MRWITAVLLAATAATAQNYRCDWSVVGIGGGEMSSTAHRCGATAGQTAVGTMSSAQFLAMIGYWQTDVPVGVREQTQLPPTGPSVTRLYAPVPSPFRSLAAIRYSLSAEAEVQLQVCDLAGRVARTIVNASQKPGRYVAHWDGRDENGALLGHGIYFCRLTAGGYRSTEKLLLLH